MEKSEQIWFDGRMVPWDQAQVHVLTHTLHYGLGVFEGIRCYAGHDGRPAIFRLAEHVDRLFGSAHILGHEDPVQPRSDHRSVHRDGAREPAQLLLHSADRLSR